jgi:tagatose 6-phosphate kinase
MILSVTLNPAVDFTVFGGPFLAHRTNRGRLNDPDPGGKGNNAARVARSLGADVTATGFLGGFTGAFVDESLRKEGIVTAFFDISGTTRFTAAYIEDESGAETKIVPDGPAVTAEEAARFLGHFERLVGASGCSIAVLSGSLPRGVPEDFYCALIGIASAVGIPVILDTSGGALAAAVGRSPFMIKPNLPEAGELAGTDDRAGIMRFLGGLARTIPVVALTLGEEGSLFITAYRAVRITARAPEAVNPVGAGDAFVGGFAAAYDRFGNEPDRLFRRAAAAGTACAGTAGLLFSPEAFEAAAESLAIEETAGQVGAVKG